MTAGCSYASSLYAGARTNKVRPDIRMSPASRKPFFVCTDGAAPPSTTLPGNRRYFFRAAFGGTAGQAPLTLFLTARFEKRHRNRFHSRDHFAARSPDTSPGVCLFVFLRNLRILRFCMLFRACLSCGFWILCVSACNFMSVRHANLGIL